MSKKLVLPDPLVQIVFACIGMGTMFCGWAALMLSAGFKVYAFDIEESQRIKSAKTVKKFVTWLHGKCKLLPATTGMSVDGIMCNFFIVRSMEALAEANPHIAFEIITENKGVKAKVYVEMNRLFNKNVLFFSNTSGITNIGEMSRRPDRTIVVHGMNPPHLTKAVEIVSSDETAPDVTEFVHALLTKRMGKMTFNAPNVPGFFVNHVGIAFWLHTIFMIEKFGMGVADIDNGLFGSLGYPQGSLKLQDFIGLDVMVLVADDMYQAMKALGYDDKYLSRYEVPDLLRGMVEKGHLGAKSGRGFYDWTDRKNPKPRTHDDLMRL